MNMPEEEPSTLPLRIVAVFVVAVVSALGCAVPLFMAAPRPDAKGPHLIKCFSAGIVCAVAFAHTLAEATANLSQISDYPISFVVAMCGAFLVIVLTQVFESFVSDMTLPSADAPPYSPTALYSPASDSLALNVQGPRPPQQVVHESYHGHHHMHAVVSSFKKQSLVVAYVMELGIVTHSLLIGVGLGVITQGGSEVQTLIVALCVHQFFEGAGLATYIAEASLPRDKTLGMVTAFSLTTSLGIMLGIAISSGYQPDSRTAVLVQGIANSISAGILIYLSLVDMVADEFTKADVRRDIGLQIQMFVALVAGAATMSVLAIWA